MIRSVFSHVSRGINARLAAKRIYYQSRIIGQDDSFFTLSELSGNIPGFYQSVFGKCGPVFFGVAGQTFFLLRSYIIARRPLFTLLPFYFFTLLPLKRVILKGVKNGAEVTLTRIGQENDNLLTFILGTEGNLCGGIKGGSC